jgi:hypothetical protein
VDQRHSDLLSELRYAMDEAFGKSERVIASIVAIQHAGQAVKIAIHTAFEDIRAPAARFLAEEADSGGMLTLNATDLVFLRDLKISVETGVAERYPYGDRR